MSADRVWGRAAALSVCLLMMLGAFTPNAVAAPANDAFSAATVLTGSSLTHGPDASTGATKEAGEPDHAGDPGGASVWYEWTAPASGSARIRTAGSDFDTVLGVYTGSAVNSLSQVAANDDDPILGCCTSRVVFSATNGTTYRIAVDGYGGATGNVSLDLSLTPIAPNDHFSDALTLVGTSLIQGPDSTVTFSKEIGEPDHAGDPGGASAWYTWTAPSDGNTTFTTAGSDFDTVLGIYTGGAVTALTPVGSNDDDWVLGAFTSRVVIRAAAGTTYRVAVDGAGGAVGDARLTIDHIVEPANDDFAAATTLLGASATAGPDPSGGASAESGEPAHAGTGPEYSLWYQWTAPADGAVEIHTSGSTFDTYLAVYTGASVGALTPVAANMDDPTTGGTESRVDFMATAGVTYRIAVDGYPATTGTVSLSLSSGPPPLPTVAWDPTGPANRTSERPRTCNTPVGTCTDSGKAWTEGAQALATTSDGSAQFLHAIYTTKAPTGDEGNGNVSPASTCSGDVDPASGSPPYCAGVYYVRSTDAGATWTGGGPGDAPLRLSDPDSHASRGAITASNGAVYAVWVETVGRAAQMCALDQRVLWLAKSTSDGATGSWSTPVAISDPGQRVDFPSVTAVGSDVWVAATDAETGGILVWASTDGGATFAVAAAGSTRATFDNGVSPDAPTCPGAPTPAGLEGYAGRPRIAATGATVAVAFIRNDSGKVITKLSTDGGATWPGGAAGWPCDGTGAACSMHLTPSGALGNDGHSTVALAASPGRLVYAWIDTVGEAGPKGVYARTYTETGGWQPKRLVSCLRPTGVCSSAPAAAIYDGASAPAITTYGTSGIALAWVACPYVPTSPAQPCNRGAADPGAEILWKESWDSGATWSAGEGSGSSFRKVAGNGATPNSVVNLAPAIAMAMPSGPSSLCPQRTASSPVGIPWTGCKRYVLFTGESLTGTVQRLQLKIGTQG